jgi:PAS domain S-box-containing protein
LIYQTSVTCDDRHHPTACHTESAPMKAEMENIPSGHLTYEELHNFVNAFPALLWRVERVKNRIEYLNNYRIEPLDSNAGLLLQNRDFRVRHVFQEDLYLVESFMQAVQNGETAATVFRLRGEAEEVIWIKLTGVLDPKNPRYYVGYMLDVTQTAGVVQSITTTAGETEAMIELLDVPALLLDPRTKVVLAHNAAAREIFGYKPEEMLRRKFSGLYHESAEGPIQRVFEELLTDKKWGGRMLFKRKDRSIFSGNLHLRLFFFSSRQVLRATIHDVAMEGDAAQEGFPHPSGGEGGPPALRKAATRLKSKVAKVADISKVLEILMENQVAPDRFDAVIFSDIHARRNKVIVYTAGNPLKAIPAGETYAYEGTIAENIDRFKLEHLIVDDTFASIKAIDWALFIPNGIRSYFAKAFYERKVMRSVLILCSTQRNHFTAQRLPEYECYYEAFLRGLKNWRTRQRGPKH